MVQLGELLGFCDSKYMTGLMGSQSNGEHGTQGGAESRASAGIWATDGSPGVFQGKSGFMMVSATGAPTSLLSVISGLGLIECDQLNHIISQNFWTLMDTVRHAVWQYAMIWHHAEVS